MDFDFQEALNFMFSVVADGGVATGVKKLIAYCRESDPKNPQWDKLAKLDFSSDARQFAEELAEELPELKSTAPYTGLYFELDGLNIPNGHGVTMGSAILEPGQGKRTDWVDDCEIVYCRGGIPSPALSETYRIAGENGVADYVLGLAISVSPSATPWSRSMPGCCWAERNAAMSAGRFTMAIRTASAY